MNKVMKKLFFLLSLGILANANLFSQDISINLSIRWSEGPYILNTDSIVKYPELVVSYTNNSDKNLYFRKFSHEKKFCLNIHTSCKYDIICPKYQDRHLH